MKLSRHWAWALLAVPVLLGLFRLHFDSDPLSLLPPNEPVVRGLQIYQKQFASTRELIITLNASDPVAAEAAARGIAEQLRAQSNLVSTVTWQPPWLEHGDQIAEMIAYLWLNQSPANVAELTTRLATTNLAAVLDQTREQLATSMSPMAIAQGSYDPFGLTQLPDAANSPMASMQGKDMFASLDRTFRVLFVEAAYDLPTYRESSVWISQIRKTVQLAIASTPGASAVRAQFTGHPAFATEISGSMKREVTFSVVGISLIIAILFWIAHRRIKPMLWLLFLLGIILVSTFAFGGLIFGSINVISLGFAAILLGLAVDYAVVHYQEALAHPELSIRQIRRLIARSIFWAAVTTICSFLVLNFGGLPGLGQLGSLVAIGVALSALVMIFGYLPPLFPERRIDFVGAPPSTAAPPRESVSRPRRTALVVASSIAIFAAGLISIWLRPPQMDASPNALRPPRSEAYQALEQFTKNIAGDDDPLWVIVSAPSDVEMSARLAKIEPILAAAKQKQQIRDFILPATLWPNPVIQASNRATLQQLTARQADFTVAAQNAGFAPTAIAMTTNILAHWQSAIRSGETFFPTNALSRWITQKVIVRRGEHRFVLGMIYPLPEKTLVEAVAGWSAQLPREDVFLSGWKLLGHSMLQVVRANMWRVVTPMVILVLISLLLAFGSWREIVLSIAVLAASGLALLTVMALAGWKWNLMNLMAVPLILGTGVDYSIFMQLALRREQGDLQRAYRSVGRALFLCGGTAVAGFGSLALSSNQGMASLGQVCALGIGFNMLISVLLLPFWWKKLAQTSSTQRTTE